MSFSMQNVQMANERVRKQSHYSILVVTIGILILGQRSSICTAKAQEKGSCVRIFEVANIFVLKLTFHLHTILTFVQLTSIHPESSEKHGFSENFLGNRSYLIRSSPFNPY